MAKYLDNIVNHQPNEPYQPTVWLCQGDNKGDFNNGLAVAKALTPENNIRIIPASMLPGYRAIEFAKDKDSVIVTFINSQTGDRTKEVIHRKDFPDVFINSASDYDTHKYVKKSTPPLPGASSVPSLETPLVVHIPPPNDPIERFHYDTTDMEVVFRHQITSPAQLHPNMRVYDTVPSPITPQMLKAGREAWKDELSVFEQTRPLYFVSIGGRLDKDTDLSIQDARNLATLVAAAIKKTGGSVVLTTSHRTIQAKEEIAAFTEGLDPQTPCYSYDYQAQKGQNNPYAGLLGLADKIVLTNDSMSMAADCIASGKPVYTYPRLPEISVGPAASKKDGTHDAYNKNLLAQKLVLPIEQLSEPPPENLRPVNSAEQIANDIRTELTARKHIQTPANHR